MSQTEDLSPASSNAVLPPSPANALSEAVSHAQLMLVHASEQGLKISPDIIQKIVKAKYLEKNQAWNETDEAEFWQIMRDISETIKPVDIDSIKAANDQQEYSSWWTRWLGRKARHTLTRRAVRRYVRGALISLFVMLLIQVYSLIGSTILNNIDSSDLKIQQLEDDMILQQRLDNAAKARALSLNIDKVADEREKNIELLALWLRPIDYLLLKEPADLSIFRVSKTEKLNNKAVYEKINDLGIRVTQSAQHPILIIASYILPLFYGLLGAYAYVLRVLSEEIRNITYSLDSDIKYILRINLGALAGLAVGLFFTPETDHLVTLNLPPLTLAFIAGYSIEFVFTSIDKLIAGKNKSVAEKSL
ncbi:MAG: hypothetical protein HC913_14205 [Microscillaceae bacterium]|nr:hypothetical protein [Microscillaceae bacterium]